MKSIIIFFIAFILNCVSTNSKANCYNKSAEEEKHKPEKVLETLKLKPTDSIADIGSGGGFYTFKFAKLVKTVYAVDVDPELLEIVKNKSKQENLTNVVPLLAKEKDSGLGDSSVDLIFNRDTFHHLPDQVAYFSELKKVLKPGGRVAIIDFNKNANLYIWLFNHYTIPEEIISKMEKAGYKLSEKHDFISDQSFFIFTLPEINKK